MAIGLLERVLGIKDVGLEKILLQDGSEDLVQVVKNKQGERLFRPFDEKDNLFQAVPEGMDYSFEHGFEGGSRLVIQDEHGIYFIPQIGPPNAVFDATSYEWGKFHGQDVAYVTTNMGKMLFTIDMKRSKQFDEIDPRIIELNGKSYQPVRNGEFWRLVDAEFNNMNSDRPDGVHYSQLAMDKKKTFSQFKEIGAVRTIGGIDYVAVNNSPNETARWNYVTNVAVNALGCKLDFPKEIKLEDGPLHTAVLPKAIKSISAVDTEGLDLAQVEIGVRQVDALYDPTLVHYLKDEEGTILAIQSGENVYDPQATKHAHPLFQDPQQFWIINGMVSATVAEDRGYRLRIGYGKGTLDTANCTSGIRPDKAISINGQLYIPFRETKYSDGSGSWQFMSQGMDFLQLYAVMQVKENDEVTHEIHRVHEFKAEHAPEPRIFSPETIGLVPRFESSHRDETRVGPLYLTPKAAEKAMRKL